MTSIMRLFMLALLISSVPAGSFAQKELIAPDVKERHSQVTKLLRHATRKADKEKALEELQALIKLAPEFVDAHLDFIATKRSLRIEPISLIGPYETYVKEQPDNAIFHFLLGYVYSAAKKLSEAELEFRKALTLNPQFGWALAAVADVEQKNGNLARARELLEKASGNAGVDVRLRTRLAWKFLNNKEDKRAFEEAAKVLETDPTYFDVYPAKWRAQMNLSFASENAKADIRYDIQNLEKRYSKDFSAWDAAEKGYEILEDREGLERARKAMLGINAARVIGWKPANIEETELMMAALLKDDPDNPMPSVFATLAKAYLAKKIKLDSALDYIERTIQFWRARPSSEYYRDYLADALVVRADILLEKKEVGRAVAAMEEAVGLKPEYRPGSKVTLDRSGELQVVGFNEPAEEEYQFKLGSAYLLSGEEEKALKVLSDVYVFGGEYQARTLALLESLHITDGKQLKAALAEAMKRHEIELRTKARDKTLNEMAKTEVKPAPDFTLSTPSGKSVRLADRRGKVILVNFWATWCGPCMKEYPILAKFQNDYRARGFEIVMVNTDTERYKIAPFLQKHILPETVVLADGEVQSKYDVRSLPNNVFIDRNGQIRLQKTGFGPGDELQLREVIEILLNENKGVSH